MYNRVTALLKRMEYRSVTISGNVDLSQNLSMLWVCLCFFLSINQGLTITDSHTNCINHFRNSLKSEQIKQPTLCTLKKKNCTILISSVTNLERNTTFSIQQERQRMEPCHYITRNSSSGDNIATLQSARHKEMSSYKDPYGIRYQKTSSEDTAEE
jgi:hypothetical protein